MNADVTVFDHPLITHKISLMRDENTSSKQFRELVEEIAMLMAYEVFRDLPLKTVKIRTPVAEADVKVLSCKDVAVVPILRAGLGMTSGILHLFPTAKVGHVGLYRDHETLKPVEYYRNLPENLSKTTVYIIDPMLATGGSAIWAVDAVKKRGAKRIKSVNIFGAPAGLEALSKAHPDVEIYLGALDRCLNENGYILPGVGDAGDRIFGTL